MMLVAATGMFIAINKVVFAGTVSGIGMQVESSLLTIPVRIKLLE